MAKLKKYESYNNLNYQDLEITHKEMWLRAKIVMQFVELRETKGYTQQDIADKIGTQRQQITRFENMSNSPTLLFLVKYATALETTIDFLLKGVNIVEY